MNGPLGILAAYFRNQEPLSAVDMVRAAAEVRAGGLGWREIAEACAPSRLTGDPADETRPAAAVHLFRDVQHAVSAAAGDGQRIAPLAWPCPDCARQVVDVAPFGRPIHVELGHRTGCTRLAAGQQADDAERRARIPSLVVGSEPPRGPLRRHRLARRFTDDCPRCGWSGYFDTWAATINGNWARLLCDDCYADLAPDITVTATYYACSTHPYDPGPKGPFAVIRQRTRSDHDFPDIGQILTWEPCWQWTPILVEEARDGAGCQVRRVSQNDAEPIMASLVGRHWPAEALALPWVSSAYPKGRLRWPG